MMNRDDVLEFENGIFEYPFCMFENIIDEVNKAMSDLDKSIQFSVVNSFKFNAHARKVDDKTYSINFRSGIVSMTFDIIAKNVDFFIKKYPELEDKEASVALGCLFIWTHIFTHELGHIIRGHVDIATNKEINLVDEDSEMSIVEIPTKNVLEKDQVKMLMEFDADVFSSYFIAKVIVNTIKNIQKKRELDDRVIVGLAISSIFLFFNHFCEIEGKSTKYPPAMVRINAIQTYIIKHLSGKTNLSDDGLSQVMKESFYDAYSFLVDENSLGQSLERIELEHLENVETHLLSKYTIFTKLISDCVFLKYAGME